MGLPIASKTLMQIRHIVEYNLGTVYNSKFTADKINSAINLAIIGATDDIWVDKEDHTLLTETDKYHYDVPSGFIAIHTIEYAYSTKIDHSIHTCDTVWDESVDAEVTETADSAFYREGSACLKLVVASGAEANDILITQDITALDLTDSDEVTAWVWSSAALSAGDVQILLDDTASCASAVESLDIPAVSAGVWTPVVISLANPGSDSAIISVGIKLITDAANTMRFDDIRAQHSDSRVYKILSPDFWNIIQGTTNQIKLTENGYSLIGANKRLRLNGYAIPAELSSDTTACEIDPEYVVAQSLAYLLMSEARSSGEDMDENFKRAEFWMSIAEKRKEQYSTSPQPNTRWVA